MELSSFFGVLAAFVASLFATSLAHARVVKFALKHNIVDVPDARKLQRRPIPVLGGVAVFFGLLVGMCAASPFVDIKPLFPMLVAMSVMLCVGVADDITGLSPRLRFVVEIAVTIMLVFMTGTSLNDFQGLWGIGLVPMWISLPLTIVAVVGIINAINLVDGVDGLSSGYCIMASIAFGAMFLNAGNVAMLLLCAISVGALLPFFLHNVFGKTSKMFIGDGGTLMMGVVMSTCVVAIVSSEGACEKCVSCGMGVVPFVLAVMCIPVCDTLRVMTMRIIRHTSPFQPDKTHMHHLFIELGFSHVGTTACELLLNVLVILSWWISYKLGASVDVQFYVVMAVGVLLTVGLYKFMRIQIVGNTAIFKFMQKIGAKTKREEYKGWIAMQKMMDRM